MGPLTRGINGNVPISGCEWLDIFESHNEIYKTRRDVFLFFFSERGRVYCDAQRQKISVTQKNFISERMFLTADDVTVQIGFARAQDSEWNCRILTKNGNSKCFQMRFDAPATWHTAKSLYVGLFSVPSSPPPPPTPHLRIVCVSMWL